MADLQGVALAPLGPDTEWLEADSAGATLELLGRRGPVDLALLDLHMPQADGLPWIARLRRQFPDAPLVVVSADERAADVKALIDLGVAGFIPKSDSAAVILQAVRLVLSGYIDLRTVTDAINRGAIYKFLTKPWDDDELRAQIQEAFRTYATRKADRSAA